MIKTAMKFSNNMVVVFNRKGRQIPEYQGRYQGIRDSVLKDAPPDAVFGHFLDHEAVLKVVKREEW